MVRLVFYQSDYEKRMEAYHLTEDQLNFTGHPKEAIEKCEREDERIPVLIISDEEIAGFFVLHRWEGVKEYWNNKNAILLRAYSIEASAQGKGIAKESLKLLPAFVKEHFPSVNEIILAVNHGNFAAQHVYRITGFIDKGIRSMGRNGELFIMHMEL